MAIVWDIPYFSTSSSWYMKNILGNWEFAPVFTYQSPEFATVQSNVDANLNGDAAGDRAFINPNGRKGTGSAYLPVCDSAILITGCATLTAANTVGYTAATPGAYYVQAGSGTAPNDLRNSLKMVGVRNVDMTAMKRINVYKQTKLEFAANIWNVLNKSQYMAGYSSSISAGASGAYTGGALHNYLIPGSPTFNNPSVVFPNNARTMQLALKFIF